MARIDLYSHVYFDTSPKIVPADKESFVTIKPIAKPPFNSAARYVLEIVSMEKRNMQSYEIKSEDGSIRFSHCFEEEQEHLVHIYEIDGGERKEKGIIHLYSLFSDLFSMRPHKGDFHVHSICSHGSETPEAACAFSRKAGLDFVAITEHHSYETSLRAINAFKDACIDFIIYPGEEVHFHGREHIVSFGGTRSCSKIYENDKSRFPEELHNYMQKIKGELDSLPPAMDSERYAACKFAVDKIREVGGIAILSHPFYIGENGYHNADCLFDYMYKNRIFDAFELINGGISTESNNLQSSYYLQERSAGIDIPFVSGTDMHTAVLPWICGKIFTVVFCRDTECSSMVDGIRKGYTAVVNSIKDQPPIVFGAYRITKFTLYLMREVFPLHDELCFEEGRLMYRYLAGDTDAPAHLKSLNGRIKRLYDKIWK